MITETKADQRLSRATRNLLFDCADLTPGDSILLVYEDPQTGWWRRDLVDTLVREAGALGFAIDCMVAGAPANQKDNAIAAAVTRYDCSIFLARIVDQDRFAEPLPGNGKACADDLLSSGRMNLDGSCALQISGALV